LVLMCLKRAQHVHETGQEERSDRDTGGTLKVFLLLKVASSLVLVLILLLLSRIQLLPRGKGLPGLVSMRLTEGRSSLRVPFLIHKLDAHSADSASAFLWDSGLNPEAIAW
jgi:hypothetical protein